MAAKRGSRGQRGPAGRTGIKGERGERGRMGLRGPRVTKHDILVAVSRQFKDTHREFGTMTAEVVTMNKALDLQLARMGQIQAQLDAIHNLVKQILSGHIDGQSKKG